MRGSHGGQRHRANGRWLPPASSSPPGESLLRSTAVRSQLISQEGIEMKNSKNQLLQIGAPAMFSVVGLAVALLSPGAANAQPQWQQELQYIPGGNNFYGP